MRKKFFRWVRDHRNALLVTFILIWGALLRSVYYYSSPFGFDQIQIAQNAALIAKGDFSLIGPRTGPAEMFTGPLIYYLAAPFTFLFSPAGATLYTAVFISSISALVLYMLGRRYIHHTQSLLILIISVFSPLLIRFDRVSWNPNLTLLAASLVFFPLIKKERLKVFDVILICCGVFLGYQAHFSGLLLLPLAAICFILRREWKWLPLALGSLILSVIPTILFDMRHDWLNYKGFTSLLTNTDNVAAHMGAPRLIEKIFIIIETTGKLFFEQNLPILFISAGLILWTIFFYSFREKKVRLANYRFLLFSLLWTIATAVLFSLYRHGTPEYYFFILLPVLFCVISRVLLFLNITPAYLLLPLGIYASLFTHYAYAQNTQLTYGNQREVVREVVLLTQYYPVKRIVYDMEDIHTHGFKYLLAQESVQFQENGTEIHIAYPEASELYTTKKVGAISIWLDPRKTQNYGYFEKSKFIIGVPNTWRAYEVIVPKPTVDDTLVFDLLPSPSSKPISLRVQALKSMDEQKLERIEKDPKDQLKAIGVSNAATFLWRPTTIDNTRGYYVQFGPQLFFINTEDSEVISKIEIVAPFTDDKEKKE